MNRKRAVHMLSMVGDTLLNCGNWVPKTQSYEIISSREITTFVYLQID